MTRINVMIVATVVSDMAKLRVGNNVPCKIVWRTSKNLACDFFHMSFLKFKVRGIPNSLNICRDERGLRCSVGLWT